MRSLSADVINFVRAVKEKMVQGSACLARGRYHGFLRPMKLKAKVKSTRKASQGEHLVRNQNE